MRKKLTAALETRVKREFNYLCAVCGKTNPQIHHIDGDHSNNAPNNLLPLCPNHHLLDAHSPTEPIDPRKLKLFRKYRDPAILLAQFQPLFRRMAFLLDLGDQLPTLKVASSQAQELVDFVQHLELGGFYAKQLGRLVLWHPGPYGISMDQPPSYYEEMEREHSQRFAAQLRANKDSAIELVVELLRFQNWRRIAPYADA